MYNIKEEIISVCTMFSGECDKPIKSNYPLYFILDDKVDYEENVINSRNLISTDSFDDYLEDLLSHNPYWVHGNVIHCTCKTVVISVLCGSDEGTNVPHINVSVEPPLFSIVDY